MTNNKVCRICDAVLNSDNWFPSSQKNRDYTCKECSRERTLSWRENNRDKSNASHRLHNENNQENRKISNIKSSRKRGHLPMSENKECPVYLGVHVNERLLKHYFNDVEVMPYGNPGYDFICNNGWKIDGKSSFTGDTGHWQFGIKRNTTADYFFCVAYDNRKDKNIIHIWMLPGKKFNHLVGASIRKGTVHKWAEYEQPIGKAILCCDSMKSGTGEKDI